MISAILATMFFVVSCDNELHFSNTPDLDDNTSDSGKTGKEGGECYKNKTCNEGLVCDEESNLCVKDNGSSEDPNEDNDGDSDSRTDADPADTQSDADEDTGNDSYVPGETTAETCSEIYQCVATCSDSSCQQECQNSGTPEAQDTFTTMFSCWMNNCQDVQTDEEYLDCILKNCCEETKACGMISSCNNNNIGYPNPYGTAQINIASNYIVTNADSQLDQSIVNFGSFITGNIGNSPIVNPDAEHSYYYTMMYTEQGETVMQTFQFFTNNAGQTILNPIVVAVTNVTAYVGSNYYGLLDQNHAGYIMLGDASTANGNLDFSCYHAFSEGELNIQNIVPSAGSEGALAVSGTIDLYSPKNYANGYGDISDQLGVPVCNPQ